MLLRPGIDLWTASGMVRPMPDILQVALECADAAGKLLASHYANADFSVTTKSSVTDLVTSADRAADREIVTRLRAAFPDHAILAEESGAQAGTAGLRWIVDPLDGTTNFTHGFPHFSVSIGLYDGETGVLGIVHDPLRGEFFCGQTGKGTWLQTGDRHDPLRVTATPTLEQSLLATGFAYTRTDPTQRSNLAEFAAMIPQVRGIRRAGSAALDLAYVAAGRLDGYWEYHLSPWDMAAGALLVEQAGGVVRTIAGEAWHPGIRSIAAAGSNLLPALLGALAKVD